jgi:hypothetical protein
MTLTRDPDGIDTPASVGAQARRRPLPFAVTLDSLRRLFRIVALFFAFFCGAFAAPSAVARSAVAPSTMTPREVRAVVEAIAQKISSDYVHVERRRNIVKQITTLESGERYRGLTTSEFATRVTEDLRAASPDKHLGLRHDPAAFKGLVAAGGASGTRAQRQDPYALDQAALKNDGYEELKILDGNIRYIRITGFHWRPDVSGFTADSAGRFMKEADAIILDLRGNGGGDSTAVQYLASHFAQDDLAVGTFRSPKTGKLAAVRVIEHLPAGRMRNKPIYLVVDRKTASAAEYIAYHLQQTGLATIIGERTSGAANTATSFPILPSFVLTVSTGRPVHPLTQSNWEGTGVEPDVAAPPSEAVQRAHRAALQHLLSSATPARRYTLSWAITGVNAQLDPYSPTAAELQNYSGGYGKQTFVHRNSALYLLTTSGAELRLKALAAGLFEVEEDPTARVRFILEDQRVVALEALYSDGEVVRIERSPG